MNLFPILKNQTADYFALVMLAIVLCSSTFNPHTSEFTNEPIYTESTMPSYSPLPMAPCIDDGSMIGGTVFNDLDFNGVDDDSSGGVDSILVRLYECGNNGESTFVDSVFTDSNGDYNFLLTAGAGPYRLEFSIPDNRSDWIPSFDGTNSATTVQFTPGASCDIDLGVIDPSKFCQDNPQVVTTCFVNGNAQGESLVKWSSDNANNRFETPGSLNPYDKTPIMTAAQGGSLWGMAFNRTTKELYSSTVLKRHVELGPGGLGAIYVTDPLAASQNGSVWYNFNIPYASNSDRGVSTTDPNNDTNAFSDVGKVGFGDIDISDDDSTLYVMNLSDTTLYALNTFGTPGVIGSWSLANVATCTDGVFRPWAVAFHEGAVYVGGVCDGSTNTINPQNLSDDAARADLFAYVYRLDGNSFTEVLGFSLDYPKEYLDAYNGVANDQVTGWYAWVDQIQASYLTDGAGQIIGYPQPILTDIEFDDGDNMILGFTDRTGYQIGNVNYGPTGTNLYRTVAGGDILYACNGGNGSWNIEGTSSCANSNGGALNGTNNTYDFTNAGTCCGKANPWPNVGEFFVGDYFQNNGDIVAPGYWPGHGENTIGGLVVIPNSGEVLVTAFDPVTGNDNFATGGSIRLSTTSGRKVTNGFELYGPDGIFAGKGVGLGDLESMCDLPPVQIGNYVWFDENGDGIQDPCESGLQGVNVSLFTPAGDSLTTVVTDANGNYLFSSTQSIPDGNGGSMPVIQADSSYKIVFGTGGQINNDLLGDTASITLANTGMGANPDLNDSDAEVNGASINGLPTIMVTVGKMGVDHSLDAGFSATSSVAVGSLVWADTNADGTQDADEDGVEDVVVFIFEDANTDGTPDGAFISSDTTDASGYYLFDGLAPGDYVIAVVPPDTLNKSSVTTNNLDSRIDTDDNGIQLVGGDTIFSPSINLAVGDEPLNAAEVGEGGEQDTEDENGDMTVDFGLVPTVCIGSTVWHDANNNGQKDGGEIPIEGVVINLYEDIDQNGEADGTSIASDTTDVLGNYLITNLDPGDPYNIITWI
ncbi:MAG: SdrD B-like domain-containing protein [Bacteroidota bacterium]